MKINTKISHHYNHTEYILVDTTAMDVYEMRVVASIVLDNNRLMEACKIFAQHLYPDQDIAENLAQGLYYNTIEGLVVLENRVW